MDILLTIIAVIVIFSALVLIHEFGHYITARRNGIKVVEFGIGFPPKLFGKKIGETEYTINAIPFGGFVKLFGEDSSNKKILANKHSFASKSPWIRTKVVVAGVVMNLLLAVVLLTVGFIFGIEPLLVTEKDLFSHIALGNVKSSPGAYVSKVSDEVVGYDILPGDKILAIDAVPITNSTQLAVFSKGKAQKDIDLTIRKPKNSEVKKIHVPLVGKDNYFGIDLKPFTEFPRLTILEVKQASNSQKAGLKKGDVILQMNGGEVYFPADFETILTSSDTIKYRVLRGTDIVEVVVKVPDTKRIVIVEVFADSAAKKAGFEKNDLILAMSGVAISAPEQIAQILKENPGKEMEYTLDRGGRLLKIKATAGKNNLVGIALSSVASFRNTELSFYRDSILTSITEVKKVHYGPWTAFKQAISESVRLTGLTIAAFGRTVVSLVSKMTVPSEIGGPVQIAYYTHTFIQQGFFALLRFAALLSLSLAVMNILPIPALDGGRLIFIVIEALTKKRVSPRIEAAVHGIGFVFLLILIVLVTWSDIAKIF